MLLLPKLAHAQTGNQTANPVVMVIVLGALALAPFVIIMLTSFVKISVVLSILRNALGTQQVPPSPSSSWSRLRGRCTPKPAVFPIPKISFPRPA
jgi:flagellar biosynthesis protein FliP